MPLCFIKFELYETFTETYVKVLHSVGDTFCLNTFLHTFPELLNRRMYWMHAECMWNVLDLSSNGFFFNNNPFVFTFCIHLKIAFRSGIEYRSTWLNIKVPAVPTSMEWVVIVNILIRQF